MEIPTKKYRTFRCSACGFDHLDDRLACVECGSSDIYIRDVVMPRAMAKSWILEAIAEAEKGEATR